jgi:hypothetical protein
MYPDESIFRINPDGLTEGLNGVIEAIVAGESA